MIANASSCIASGYTAFSTWKSDLSGNMWNHFPKWLLWPWLLGLSARQKTAGRWVLQFRVYFAYLNLFKQIWVRLMCVIMKRLSWFTYIFLCHCLFSLLAMSELFGCCIFLLLNIFDSVSLIFSWRHLECFPGVVAIEPEWLPIFAPKQCNMLTPLEDPPPSYDPEGDRVTCWVTGTFGKEAWELPQVRIEHPDALDRFRWFGVFFLDGSIIPSLKRFSSSLLSPPSTMVKSWARLQPRTNAFLQTLISRRIDTQRKLEEVWSTDKTCEAL